MQTEVQKVTAEVEQEPKLIIYRKSIHFPEEPISVSLDSARASISAWRQNVDAAVAKLQNGGVVKTRNHNFYGKLV